MNFAEWLPDQPAFENAGATEAKNGIPAAKGYTSFQDLGAISGAATNDISGMYAAKDDDGVTSLYVGDEGKLYLFSTADSSLTD